MVSSIHLVYSVYIHRGAVADDLTRRILDLGVLAMLKCKDFQTFTLDPSFPLKPV